MKKISILLTLLLTILTVSPALGATTVTSTDLQQIQAAKAALYSVGRLNPLEGRDTNIITMAQTIVNKSSSGVLMTIIYNYNKQIATTGKITYGSAAVAGNVTFKLFKGSQYTTATCYVTVPVTKGTAVVSPPIQTTTSTSSSTPTTTVKTPTTTTTTGSTASTTTSSVAAGSYNVKNYGAKGDGVTDDSAAFNSAITAASSKGGGTVTVPAGTYRISMGSGITMKSNVTLSMYGATLLDHAVVGRSMINIGNGVDNVAVLGGIIEGPAKSAGGAENYNSGITMWESPTDITIKDLEIRYFMCDGIYLGCSTSSSGAPNGVLVENCYIHHCGRNGLSLISQRNATYRNNEIAYIGLTNRATSTGAGFKFEANASGGKNWVGENILVEGNDIHDCHIFGLMVSDYWDRSNPVHPVSITLKNNNVYDNATLGTASYSINADNCLEFATYNSSRWIKWDGTLYSSSSQNGLKTW